MLLLLLATLLAATTAYCFLHCLLALHYTTCCTYASAACCCLLYIFQNDLLPLATCYGHSSRNIKRVKKRDIFVRCYICHESWRCEFLTKSRQNSVAIRDHKTCFFMWHSANVSLNVEFVKNDSHATNTAGWRLITFPCGMTACVTPRGTPHSPKGSLVSIRVFVKCSSAIDQTSSYAHF